VLSRLLTGAYGVLLRLYPRGLRARYAAEMARVFEDRLRAAGRSGRVAVLRTGGAGLVDVVRGAVAEWVWAVVRHDGMGWARERSARTIGVRIMNGLMRDIRHGLRSLRRSAAFTAASVLTIGLGIGANAAIFSVVRAVLLRPLPYPDADRLALVWTEMTRRNVTYFPVSPPDLLDYRTLSTEFEQFAGVFTFPQSLTGDGDPVQIETGLVTTNFFSLLGVRPVLGRDFVDDDDNVPPQAAPGVQAAVPQLNAITILSWDLWQTRYGGDPSIIGRIIDLGGTPSEVVGVAPRDFELLMPAAAALASDVDAWIAARIDFENANRDNVFLRVIGRLKPEATLASAQADMDRVAADLRARFTIKETSGHTIRVIPMHADIVAPVRPVLLVLMGAVVFLLLIACANVANLMLVRSTTRERELAVRAAVGGNRWRLVRQTLVESLLLGGAGMVLGVALALAGVQVLRVLQPEQLPRIGAISLDATVLAYTAVATVLAAAVFGIVPALRASRPAIVNVLREGGRTPGLNANRLLRSGVIVAEVALSLVLLIGAGLMVRTFAALQRVDPGFQSDGLLLFNAPLPFGRYPGPEERRAFNDQLSERIAGLPGVESVSAASPLPLNGIAFNGRWGLEPALTDPQAFQQADYRTVLPGYFETMRTPLLTGRTFTEADDQTAAPVVVVDEELARKAFPGRSAIGERILIRVVTPDPVWVEIIGVVQHQRHENLARVGRETVYFTRGYAGDFGMTWVLRVSGDPVSLVGPIRDQVAALDARIPVADVGPMSELVERAMAPTRFALTLIGTFAIIALALAAIGLYGVLAYAVRQRTAEIGVRMAFGARETSILGMVVGQGLRLSVIGIALGVTGAILLTRLIETMLVGVAATDPLTFAGITLLFLVVSALASLLPALRAARIDPIDALRE
jgi:putative ABC transport system permease protein